MTAHCKYLQPVYSHWLCYISNCNLAVIITANDSTYDNYWHWGVQFEIKYSFGLYYVQPNYSWKRNTAKSCTEYSENICSAGLFTFSTLPLVCLYCSCYIPLRFLRVKTFPRSSWIKAPSKRGKLKPCKNLKIDLTPSKIRNMYIEMLTKFFTFINHVEKSYFVFIKKLNLNWSRKMGGN